MITRYTLKDIKPIKNNEKAIGTHDQIYSYNYSKFLPYIKNYLIPSEGYFIEQDFSDSMFYVYLDPFNIGASGAPVMLKDNNGLVGMIVKKYNNNRNQSKGFAYVVSPKKINDKLNSVFFTPQSE